MSIFWALNCAGCELVGKPTDTSLFMLELPPELIVLVADLADVGDAVALALACRCLFEVLLVSEYTRKRVYRGATPELLIKNGVWDMVAEYRNPDDEKEDPHAFLISSRNLYTPAWDGLVDSLCVRYNTSETARTVLSPDLLRQVAIADEITLHELFPLYNHTFLIEANIWLVCARHALFAGNPDAFLHLMTFVSDWRIVYQCMDWLKEGHSVAKEPLRQLFEDDALRKFVARDLKESDLSTGQKEAIYTLWPSRAWLEVWNGRWPLLVLAFTLLPTVLTVVLCLYFVMDAMLKLLLCQIVSCVSFALFIRLNGI